MPSLSKILSVKDLSCGYGKSLIVKKVSLDMGEDEIVSLLGPNGSGKSTFLKGIIGANTIFSGDVIFKEKQVTRNPLHQIIKMGMGYVPQVSNVFTDLSVYENLEMGGYPQDDKSLKEQMEIVFELFPILEEREEQKAGTLSGGERQMLAMGRCLVNEPDFLILDEPTAGLAPKIITDVHRKIEKIHETGIPIIMAEQNARKALEISDRALVLVSGECTLKGSSEEMLDKDLSKVFFGKEQKE